MIYSKNLQHEIPTQTYKKQYNTEGFGVVTRYTVKDNRIPVGYVDLKDTSNGVEVMMIKNMNPNLYKNFGKYADQLEVEHCMERGLQDFEITSNAALNSHALHFLRGKRFVDDCVTKIVQMVINTTPKGETYNTQFIGPVKMFMPKELIHKYIDIIKKNPILK